MDILCYFECQLLKLDERHIHITRQLIILPLLVDLQLLTVDNFLYLPRLLVHIDELSLAQRLRIPKLLA